MESETSPNAADHLTSLRRAEILTHTRYPKLGWWYPPAFGLAAAASVAAYALPIWASLPIWVALLAVFGAAVRRYLDRRGTTPDPRRAPSTIKTEMVFFAIGYALTIGAIVTLWTVAPWWVASAATFVAFTIGLTVYERRYAAAAHRAEVIAGIDR